MNTLVLPNLDKLKDEKFIFQSLLDGTFDRRRTTIILIKDNEKLLDWDEFAELRTHYRVTYNITLITKIRLYYVV